MAEHHDHGNAPIEDRLRRHVADVSARPSPVGMEGRIHDAVAPEREHRHRASTAMPALVLTFVLVVLATAMVLTIVGAQSSNVFSNVSNGLSQ